MRKLDRLYEIVQLLRGQRLRTAEYIAGVLGVSVRTIYRDIQALIASGVPIEGERGIGYIIRQSIDLPPLKFTQLELQALQLGIKMVAATADDQMAEAAHEASLKILDALPTPSKPTNTSVTHVYFASNESVREVLAILRDAVDERRKVKIQYGGGSAGTAPRTLRPLGLEYWGKVWTLTAWCELRDDFRVFRLDRIDRCTPTGDRFKNERGRTYQDYLDRQVQR